MTLKALGVNLAQYKIYYALARLIHHGLAVGAAFARDHGSAWRVVAAV